MMKALAYVVMALLVAGACGAPAYERGAHVPADAKLEYWPKIGWGWELCIDASADSTFFTWSAEGGGGPFIRVRQAACAAGKDPRDVLRVEGSAQGVEFLFPEAPDTGAEMGGEACPYPVPPETLARFSAALEAAISSGKLTPEAVAEATGMMAQLGQVKLERLWLSGGVGNADAWSLRCKEISKVIPETSPVFPDALKTGE
jgi:hypothetical protein